MTTTANHGETDLNTLLANLSPTLLPSNYVFCALKDVSLKDIAYLEPLACVSENEGISMIMMKSLADHEGFSYKGIFRCIRLDVHSSLEAVGLTAAVSGALAAQNISANIIAGFHHDHIFVPCDRAEDAMTALNQLKS